ncbi:MAG TPA: sensor histidine kinase [Saprospiraceae bacterium]|nr:sensor histidine kinase [Saprospiraceae bacterium]
MKISTGVFIILFQVISLTGLAQQITGEQAILIDALLDSAEIYELREPTRALQFATEVLSRVPVRENEIVVVRALLYTANIEKILLRTETALEHANQAIALAHQLQYPELLVRSYFMKASIFGHAAVADSTLIYYQKAIEYHEEGLSPYFVSQAHTNIGMVYHEIGNDEKAEEYLLKGYQIAKTDDHAKIFSLSELIGFYAAGNNPKYLPYVDTLSMTDFYKKASHSSLMAHFDSFLRLENATTEQKVAKIREVYTYSTTHSSYVNQVGYGLKLYELLVLQRRYDDAHELLEELLEKAKRASHGRHIATVTRALYENSKLRGRLDEAFAYLERYGELRDSLISEENRNTISELNVKFEAVQKDLEIGQQKIRIEQERRNRNFFIILALLLSAMALLIFFYFKNRVRTTRRIAEQDKLIHEQEKVRMQREMEVAELTSSLETQERERNRIARDLHDGLGSLMSGISAQIETLRAQPAIESAGSPYLGQLRDMVKEATGELRRTSYELMPASLLRQGLEPAIRDLCMNLLVKNGIEPVLEIHADLTTLNHEQQLTLYRIIQELLNNTVKHAAAKNVLIQFNSYDHEISLIVEDDGKGFDVPSRKELGGLGLGSLQSRVNLLKGFLDIASIPGEGTTVTVNFRTSP